MNLKRIPNKSLSEIGQSMATRFAILSEDTESPGDFIQRTPMVRCRDFLCDVFSSSLEKKDFSIYGMSWKGTTDSIDMTRGVFLLMVLPNQKAKEDFHSNLTRLHAIEEQNDYALTTVSSVTDLEIIVSGDPRWLNSVLSFSLYTLLLRVFCYTLQTNDWITEFSKMSHSDSKYIASWPRESLDRVLADLSILKMEEWNGLSYAEGTHAVHSNSGIISVFSTHSEINTETVRKNKHWKVFQKLGLPTCVK